MTTESAVDRLRAVASSYIRDADAMKRDPENFSAYDCVAYTTIANEIRKVAAQIEAEPK
jgi:hypothetical protein